jgi:3-methyladenine DNA glycosylase AlkD
MSNQADLQRRPHSGSVKSHDKKSPRSQGSVSRFPQVHEELLRLADPVKAKDLQWFFKTGPGEYGEGDRFLGIRVPEIRKLARKHKNLTLPEVKKLLHSAFHEERALALCILVDQYHRSEDAGRAQIYRLYEACLPRINNWDLVDGSAPHIVGGHFAMRDRTALYRFVRSRSLWRRRIAVLATLHFIRRGEFADTFNMAEMLLADREDLIHKAVGWMLREVGNRNPAAAESFLALHYGNMPRTMLRYAIEKFPEPQRQKYLAGTIQSPE